MCEENFRIITEILSVLEKQLDAEVGTLNWKLFSPETLGISQQRWARILVMLEEEKLIKGFAFSIHDGQIINNSRDGRITLKGLEYLRDNK